MTRRAAATTATLVLSAGLLTACTAGPDRPTARTGPPDTAPAAMRLVSSDDCTALLDALRAAARANLGAWGYRGRDLGGAAFDGERTTGDRAVAPAEGAAARPPDTAQQAVPGTTDSYSGTNTHEAGVDEPDLVKTDGRRILTVQDGVLRIVDASTRRQVGRLDLNPPGSAGTAAELLLAGDRAIVIGRSAYRDFGPADDRTPAPQVTLVDLAGSPRVLGRYAIDGSVVDARQVGGTVRVVVRSVPRIERPDASTPAAYAKKLTEAIDRADLDAWLPGYTVQNDGRRSTGRVDCAAVSRPAETSASNLITVLTFDLGRAELGNGDPVSVVADGSTVYSNGPALYIASDQRWRTMATTAGRGTPAAARRTDIWKFDTSGAGRPSFVAGGTVDGWLLNQYSMSDWNGHLRVATTDGDGRRDPDSESAVYVLRQDGRQLSRTGRVGGLGRGERIYSVRFTGGTAYVVTFRQTDPLYTVDLRDPAKPVVTGELKITGYSAYLHPAGDGRLIGIGQEANTQGRTQGTQISLFDVRDPAAPRRLAQYHVAGAHSEAEFDPHAFLYWPATGLLVVPLARVEEDGRPLAGKPATGALALRITGDTITELGTIEHPDSGEAGSAAVRRSLVIEGTLWTVSYRGLLASDLRSAARQAWIPFT